MVSLVKYDRTSSFATKVERRRLLSDNYNAYLIPLDEKGHALEEFVLNLGDLGLKSLKWDIRTEEEIFRPCTTREEIVLVDMLGFDFELSFDKNSSDIMYLLLGQHARFHGQVFGLNATTSTFTRESISSLIGLDLKTEYKEGNVISPITSVWAKEQGQAIQVEHLLPKYDLKINIQHFNTLVETYIFKNFVIKKGSQDTQENSSTITESISGHAGWVEIGGTELPNYKTIRALQESYDNYVNKGKDSLRAVSNTTNVKLLSEKSNKV